MTTILYPKNKPCYYTHRFFYSKRHQCFLLRWILLIRVIADNHLWIIQVKKNLERKIFAFFFVLLQATDKNTIRL